MTQASAANPPKAWTTAEPAKSLKPLPPFSALIQPPPQCHEPTHGYARPTSSVAKMRNGSSLTRSATAPETMVAAVAANMAWKMKSP